MKLTKNKSYIKRMIDTVKEFSGKFIKYVNTPLQALIIFAALIPCIFWVSGDIGFWLHILMGLFCIIVLYILVVLLFNPNILQLTSEARSHIAIERLGDDSRPDAYFQGQIEGMGKPDLIEDKGNVTE